MKRNVVMKAFLKRHAMIRKIFFISLFLCLGLVLAGVTLLATYENRYQEILRLKRESERIPEAERKAKAQLIAAKMFARYESTKYLSFKSDAADYWCEPGSLSARLPLDRWAYRTDVTHFNLAMTPKEQRTEVFVEGKQILTYFRRDGRFYEFQWPHNGVPGMYTDYPVASDGPRNTVLRRGIDGRVLCNGGVFLHTWVGPEPHHPTRFKHCMESGYWIGTAKMTGETCDVILAERQDIERWDVFYVNPRGFVVMWIFVEQVEETPNPTLVSIMRYTGINTDPIPPNVFVPPKALLAEAEAWHKLTETEAQVEAGVE